MTNQPPKTTNDLPLKGAKNAPKTFKGKYEKVHTFFREVETACASLGINDPADQCIAVVRYCSQSVNNVIEGLAEYRKKDYNGLKSKLTFIYDAERSEVKYRIADIYPLVTKWSKTKIGDLATFKNYYKEFQKIVGWLHVRGKLSDDDFKLWFWAGLPKRAQRQLEGRMRIEDPNLDDTQPFDVDKV